MPEISPPPTAEKRDNLTAMECYRVNSWTGAMPPGYFVSLWAIRNGRFTRAVRAALARLPHGEATTRSRGCTHYHTVMAYADAREAGIAKRGMGYPIHSVPIIAWPAGGPPPPGPGEPDL